MSAPHSALDRLLSWPSEVRCAHIWGHGDWFPIADEPTLSASVCSLNAQYGAGTHWLEFQ